jgi:hypothetical protein
MTDETQLVRLILNAEQARQLTPILEASERETRVSGVLFSVRAFTSLADGSVVTELQAMSVDPRKAAKVMKILEANERSTDHPIGDDVESLADSLLR